MHGDFCGFFVDATIAVVGKGPTPKSQNVHFKITRLGFHGMWGLYECVYDVYLCAVEVIALYFTLLIQVNANNLD